MDVRSTYPYEAAATNMMKISFSKTCMKGSIGGARKAATIITYPAYE